MTVMMPAWTMTNSDNPGVGAEFERLVRMFFETRGVFLQRNFPVSIGAGATKKPHRFDLGCETPPVLVECKCHVWTGGGNSPSAKLAVWNEAMFYFSVAPPKYRKVLVVQRSLRGSKTLVEHYLDRYGHLVPPDVELWEFDSASTSGRCVRERLDVP